MLTDFDTPFGIEQRINTGASANTHMMAAFGANIQGGGQVLFIKDGLARRAFNPHTFRYTTRTCIVISIDFRKKNLINPTHYGVFLIIGFDRRLRSWIKPVVLLLSNCRVMPPTGPHDYVF